MHRRAVLFLRSLPVLIAGLVCFSATLSPAANFTWDGNAPGGMGNSKWSTANNWGAPDTANTAPPTTTAGLTTSDLFFDGNLKTSPQMDNNYFIRTLTFNSGASAFTLTPQAAEILSIGTGGIVNNSVNVQTINTTLSLSNAQTWSASSGALVVNAAVRLGANTLTVSGGSTTTITNIVSGSGGIVRSGTGSLVLSAANTYSGGTTISSGKVSVNNATGSATGTGHVTINSSGTLTGGGLITGAVTNNSGGTIAAGNNGVGQLGLGASVFKGGSTLEFQIKDVDAGAGTGWDLINIAGGLNISATFADKMFVDIHSLTAGNTPGSVADFDPAFNYSWTILKTTTGILFQAGENEDTAIGLLSIDFQNPTAGTFTLDLLNSGKDLALVYTATPVPEPTTWSLMALGGIAFGWIARRRKRS